MFDRDAIAYITGLLIITADVIFFTGYIALVLGIIFTATAAACALDACSEKAVCRKQKKTARFAGN